MVVQTRLTTKRAKDLADFRLIPRIETFPRVVSFVQTSVG
jgi:hypothetical protein